MEYILQIDIFCKQYAKPRKLMNWQYYQPFITGTERGTTYACKPDKYM